VSLHTQQLQVIIRHQPVEATCLSACSVLQAALHQRLLPPASAHPPQEGCILPGRA